MPEPPPPPERSAAPDRSPAEGHDAIGEIYRTESRAVLATLIRLLGDFELAEDALHEAFTAALRQWPTEGIPANPRSWLISAGRFRGIDAIRRRVRHEAHTATLEGPLAATSVEADAWEGSAVEDDRLRLLFTCCHPALAPEARIALTLREVCGLGTDEVARAFLTSTPTLAQRLVRAKRKIRDARIPYEVPTSADLPERLAGVLRVVYLVFTEGYSASGGDDATRPDLTAEAIRLARLLHALLPREAEIRGLLGMMLLHEARRAARTDARGDLVLLEDQDRTRWNREMIGEGVALVEGALQSGTPGPYAVQGAIAALHAEAEEPAATDWPQIVALYDVLLQMAPSPVVALNRAAALAMRDGPAVALPEVDRLLRAGGLERYAPAHAVRGELSRRLGDLEGAREGFRAALAFTRQAPERRLLERRLAGLTPPPPPGGPCTDPSTPGSADGCE